MNTTTTMTDATRKSLTTTDMTGLISLDAGTGIGIFGVVGGHEVRRDGRLITTAATLDGAIRAAAAARWMLTAGK
jgi:hypothetical protein